MGDTRPTWDELFISLAQTVARRSTCNRAQVGAVIVRDNNIVSLGYNGSVSGADHCLDHGCLLDPAGKCCRTLHAEANAILNASKNETSVVGSKIYITHIPCFNCYRTLLQAGIVAIAYLQDYNTDYVLEMISKAGLPNILTKVNVESKV